MRTPVFERLRCEYKQREALLAWLAPVTVLVLAAMASVGMVLRPMPTFATEFVALADSSNNITGDHDESVIPPGALAATLWDELFPAPPPPPPPEAPPKLDLELVAIATTPPPPPPPPDPPPAPGPNPDTRSDLKGSGVATRRAILFRLDLSEIVELGEGESLPGRANVTLIKLADRSATFDVGGRTVTLELRP